MAWGLGVSGIATGGDLGDQMADAGKGEMGATRVAKLSGISLILRFFCISSIKM